MKLLNICILVFAAIALIFNVAMFIVIMGY